MYALSLLIFPITKSPNQGAQTQIWLARLVLLVTLVEKDGWYRVLMATYYLFKI